MLILKSKYYDNSVILDNLYHEQKHIGNQTIENLFVGATFFSLQ